MTNLHDIINDGRFYFLGVFLFGAPISNLQMDASDKHDNIRISFYAPRKFL